MIATAAFTFGLTQVWGCHACEPSKQPNQAPSSRTVAAPADPAARHDVEARDATTLRTEAPATASGENESSSVPGAPDAPDVPDAPDRKAIHVIVALADNEHQGIVPVPGSLGNGDKPRHNLYWGAMYGIRTYFTQSPHWKKLECGPLEPTKSILERCRFEHKRTGAVLTADVADGRTIREATRDFLVESDGRTDASLVAYIGHDGLMDFRAPYAPKKATSKKVDTVILACASKAYFAPVLRQSHASPLLWTTDLMAPEAYSLEAALEVYLAEGSGADMREAAARAYAKYQKISVKSARRLFVTGY